ncbi:MAG: hypothetical protein LUF78_00070 [Clostridiales bacterium]|nr:hypothetical protein [Clostridiales bacterium]
MEKAGKAEYIDRLNFSALWLVSILGAVTVVRYGLLGEMTALVTVVILEILFVSLSCLAWSSRISAVFLLVGVPALVAFNTLNGGMAGTVHMFCPEMVVVAGAALCAAVLGTILAIWKGKPPRRPSWIPLVIVVFTLGAVLGVWKWQTERADALDGFAVAELWSVPDRYDKEEASSQGTLEELVYETKAYATDERSVTKSAWVYLPAGYDEEEEYNILYLLHGTGDDEEYWLVTHSENKTMLDQMIANGDIDPLIVVTPTFYVEDDCEDDLDQLTYSFAQELRNDLMPAVEETYSTYAQRCDEEGFVESREHRAFAGLSRGAVTMYHSALCGSLDYFSWFGAFSGSRTDADYFQETLQSEDFADYSINYLYVASGNFDFALPGQAEDYESLLQVEPRLVKGVNTDFDVFPMRYHSAGSWHLALYNYLQRIF